MAGVRPTTELPSDTNDQAYVSVHAFVVGGLWLPYREIFQDCLHEPTTVGSNIPVLTFMLAHPTKGRALFDLGIRKKGEGYPPGMKSTLEEFKVYCEEDIVDLLQKGNVQPSQIERIIYSHLHWDHTGDPAPFTSAEIILGLEGKPHLDDAYPHNPTNRIASFPSGRKVTFIDFSDSKVISPFGTFERALDLYGDGTLYLVDSPGHMLGHLALVARVGPNSFVFLAGDTCHNRLSYDPALRELSEVNYADVVTARKTVQKLAQLHRQLDNVIVILAHENERLEEMPFFPMALNAWALEEVEKRKAPRKK